MNINYPYNTVALGGTFDRLHSGHQYFISHAFKLGKKVVIGITSDDYVQKKLLIKNKRYASSNQLQNHIMRKNNLIAFLKNKGWLARASINKIHDVYGSLQSDIDVEALIVTRNSLPGGKLIQEIRKKEGLKPIILISIPLLKTSDNKILSSSRIRSGEIDKWGRIFAKLDILDKPINDNLRQYLKKPQGILLKGDIDKPEQIVTKLNMKLNSLKPQYISTIGDEVTKLCNSFVTKPKLAIVDFKVQRKKKYFNFTQLGYPLGTEFLFRVRNRAGSISHTLVKAVIIAFKKINTTNQKQIIKVLGEEDLTALPVILFAPLGAVVLYGQPNEGIVLVEITQEKKQDFIKMITKLL